MSRRVVVKVDAFRVINDALGSAIEAGMNKTDRWCSDALTTVQRDTLRNQITNYFWTALEEAGVELA